jgi:ATP-dependent DNA helicase RecG
MAGKTKVDARKMMELAITAMNQSIEERRGDGKASPAVGAVLVHRDGRVESASRGELRDGDHAEYTLLERKNRHTRLDGAVLFSTLEPCAPGSRRHPKLSCAERIVLARIREVWVRGVDDLPRGERGDSLRKEHTEATHEC